MVHWIELNWIELNWISTYLTLEGAWLCPRRLRGRGDYGLLTLYSLHAGRKLEGKKMVCYCERILSREWRMRLDGKNTRNVSMAQTAEIQHHWGLGINASWRWRTPPQCVGLLSTDSWVYWITTPFHSNFLTTREALFQIKPLLVMKLGKVLE